MVSGKLVTDICVYILTWNVASIEPDKTVCLNDALSLTGISQCAEGRLPDIFVIGLQDLKKWTSHKEHPWEAWIGQHIDAERYRKLGSKQLLGTFILLYVQNHHVGNIHSIEKMNVGVAKGTVSIRLTMYSVSVAFTCSHLIGSEDFPLDISNAYKQIMATRFTGGSVDDKIIDHGFGFWFGDLNFRISGRGNASKLRAFIAEDNLRTLLRNDQLLALHNLGQLDDFKEGAVLFPPTFKFTKGTQKYDEATRPAWCDRILYRVTADHQSDITLKIKQHSYRYHSDYKISDHKPVSATFTLKIISKGNQSYYLLVAFALFLLIVLLFV